MAGCNGAGETFGGVEGGASISSPPDCTGGAAFGCGAVGASISSDCADTLTGPTIPANMIPHVIRMVRCSPHAEDFVDIARSSRFEGCMFTGFSAPPNLTEPLTQASHYPLATPNRRAPMRKPTAH